LEAEGDTLGETEAEGDLLALGDIEGETDELPAVASATLKATSMLSSIRPVVPATCRASQLIVRAPPLLSWRNLKMLNGVSSVASHWSMLGAVDG
jgi:hypothetical protein